MKKGLVLTLIALMLLSGSAFATWTRVTTLGEANNFVLDEANIWMYAARINMYPNIAIGEIGAYDPYFSGSSDEVAQLGVHWTFCNQKNPWVIGTYFYSSGWQEPAGSFLGLSNTMLPFHLPMPDLSNWTVQTSSSNKRVTAFVGHMVGSNYGGFSFNKVQSSYKDQSSGAGSGAQAGVGEYDFAFGLTDHNGKWDLGAGIDLFSFSWMTDATHHVFKPKGNNTIWITGRWFHQTCPTWTLVPNAGFIFGKYEADHYNGAATEAINYSEKHNVFTAYGGLGAHYTPASNVLAVGEVGIAYGTYKYTYTDAVTSANTYEYKVNIFTLPYFKMGFEGKVFDWMDVRFGAVSYWHRETDEQTLVAPYKSKYNYPDNQTYFGTGLHFGNFHIDTYTDPEIFLNGFHFISGQSTDLNARVSVLYEFK